MTDSRMHAHGLPQLPVASHRLVKSCARSTAVVCPRSPAVPSGYKWLRRTRSTPGRHHCSESRCRLRGRGARKETPRGPGGSAEAPPPLLLFEVVWAWVALASLMLSTPWLYRPYKGTGALPSQHHRCAPRYRSRRTPQKQSPPSLAPPRAPTAPPAAAWPSANAPPSPLRPTAAAARGPTRPVSGTALAGHYPARSRTCPRPVARRGRGRRRSSGAWKSRGT